MKTSDGSRPFTLARRLAPAVLGACIIATIMACSTADGGRRARRRAPGPSHREARARQSAELLPADPRGPVAPRPEVRPREEEHRRVAVRPRAGGGAGAPPAGPPD